MTVSTALLNLLWSALSVAAGAYILLFGRRVLWVSLGVIGLAAALNLLTAFVAGAEEARDLLVTREWLLLGIAALVGLGGVTIGRARPDIGGLVIGFLAGADIGLWFFEIARYVTTESAQLSEQAALIAGVAIAVLGGLGGVWLVRHFRDEALIIITMLVGAELVFRGLRLSDSSSLTALLLLSLGLLSVVVQYADYLRELKADTPLTQYLTDRATGGSHDRAGEG